MNAAKQLKISLSIVHHFQDIRLTPTTKHIIAQFRITALDVSLLTRNTGTLIN